MITLSGFGKDYGDFTAVESIDLNIEAGETFGFIGPNGAGKSTTIRFLATLLRASRGHGTVAGCDVMGDPVGVRQAVGYMPDMFGVVRRDARLGVLGISLPSLIGLDGRSANRSLTTYWTYWI